MTHTEPATEAKLLEAKQFKVQDVLSLILAAATAIAEGNLDDDIGPAEGIAIAPEDARSLLYDLFDCLGLDKEAEAAMLALIVGPPLSCLGRKPPAEALQGRTSRGPP